MITNSNKNPDLSEAIQYVIRQSLAQINTGLPASIVKYDTTKQLAQVQLEVSQLYEDGESLIIPPLVNVPVERYRSSGGNAYLVTPIRVGDKGWVKFSQRTIDHWLQDGKQQNMTSLRMFDLSDAVFFPGLYPKNKPIDEDNENTVLRNEGSRHILSTSGHDIKTDAGGSIKIIDEKISIGNNIGDVLSLFNDLLSQLLITYGVSPAGPAPLDPATVAEVTRIQTILNQIRV